VTLPPDMRVPTSDSEIPRVGLLLPSTNTVMEPDLWGALWQLATLHTFRIQLDDVTAEAESRMLSAAPGVAEQLRRLRPRISIFGCTSAGGLLGWAGEQQLTATLEARSGSEVVSILGAVNAVLRDDVGASTVAVFTPYVEALSAGIAGSLEACGFHVEQVSSLGLTDNAAIASLSPGQVRAAVSESLGGTTADAVFVSCTNLRSMSVADDLAEQLGRPVVTSNQAVARVVRQRLTEQLELMEA